MFACAGDVCAINYNGVLNVQIHFMDPEDLLEEEVEPLGELPEHIDENRKAIATLQQKGLNFRYII